MSSLPEPSPPDAMSPELSQAAGEPVAVVLPSRVGGGAERTGSELANYWAGQGRRVALITMDAATERAYPLDPRIQTTGLGLMRVSRSLVASLWNNTLRVRRLRQALLQSAARHVVSFTDITNVTTLLACRDTSFDVVVCERTEPRRHSIGPIWSRLRQRTYSRARAIVVQTEAVRNWALAQGWRVPVYVIPNAAPVLNPGPWPPTGRPRPAVVALGRLSREKGMDLLLDAFARIAGDFPDWHLRIHGEGNQRAELEQRAARLGIANRFELAGWTTEPQAALRDGDIFVLPSRYEGFPNALLEAMAVGLPCVAFDCDSGPREIIRPGEDGLLVPPEDTEALAASLASLIGRPALRERLGQRAAEVTHRFRRSLYHQRWDAVLRRTPPSELDRLAADD